MDRLLRFLLDNPIIAVVVVFWIFGAINNARTAAKRREQSARRAERGPAAEPAHERQPPARLPETDAEQVAREMRRILGLPETAPQARPAPRPVAPPPPVERRAVERPPTPVRPTTQARKLDVSTRRTQIGSHVGEAMAHRRAAPSAEIGSLGGRVESGPGSRQRDVRFAMTDLRRVLVLGEILGPPLALRDPTRRLL